MKDNDCIFCKIAAGDIPATKVYEDDVVVAFKDLNPMMPVHTLIIPKEHYDNIADDIPDATLAHLMRTVGTVADAQGVRETGFRIIANTGADACQSVGHVHIHVLGGAPMNDGDPSLS
ncbi:histidine triad nucleotide-binding protein [Adlercreutzia murintestinalis]|jgi:Diadenosine tetraphosphate (Ap4A) hydrolase and other HIT family hydrolases|uniref:histidine triad nucleotide-binding protein n=1 Tax=Adlercreutzia murintestinalis TaxID=2941325 RepID=UPI00203EE12F|nr:histidine triad nucleotide-binding protein [Adlercreutzia murintestinalis]